MTTSPRPSPTLRRLSFWIPLIVCFGVNTAIIGCTAANNPGYLTGHELINSPDAKDYLRLGWNMLLHGAFSRSESPPYVPDMLRTPVFPLFVAGLDYCGRPAAIYVVQALLQVASCAVMYLMVDRMFGARAAFLSSLFVATDLMWSISNFEPLSEPLFAFLLLCSLHQLSRGLVLDPVDAARWPAFCRAGLLLGLAIMVRSIALYLIPLFAAAPLFCGSDWKGGRSRMAAATLVTVAAVIQPVAWAGRNYLVLSQPRFAYQQYVNLVYYVGAGAYQVEHGIDIETAQRAISEEFNLPPLRVTLNTYQTGYPLEKVIDQFQRVWPKVMFKYPQSLVIASCLGIVKSICTHNVNQLAEVTGRSWIAPKAGDLIRLQSRAFVRLFSNGPILAAAMFWELAHTSLAIGAALLGLTLMLKTPGSRPFALFLLVTLAYLYATIALFGFEAYYRYRFPTLPFLYLLAGVGSDRLASFFPASRGLEVAAARG